MNTSDQTRYVALDLHKHYAVAAAVNRDGEVLLHPQRIDNDRLPAWAQKHLLPTDLVVIEVPDAVRFQVELDLETLHYLEGQIQRISAQLAELSHQEPWASQAMYLMQLPGFGVVTPMTVLGAIGDISRIPSPKQLVSYGGLAPGVEQSGTKHRAKPITKEGRKELRHVLVEAAWTAARKHPNDAIVVIARKLLVIVWYVLSRQEPYHHYSEEKIAYKFLIWSWRLDESQRRGMSRPQFVRYYLMRMGIGHNLKRIALDPRYPRRVAPPEEVEGRLRAESAA